MDSYVMFCEYCAVGRETSLEKSALGIKIHSWEQVSKSKMTNVKTIPVPFGIKLKKMSRK